MLSETRVRCPGELVEDSYLAQLGQADEVWSRLSRGMPAGALGHLPECVFLMLKPDALVSGRYESLLSGMAEAGWQLLHAQATLTASERHFEELYQYNLTIRNEQNMMCAWWINKRLYAMGPSVALMVRVPPHADGLTAHQQVKRLKGPSNPFKGSPGELRWDAGGTNLALNLLHSADDPISSAREFLIFHTEDQLLRALGRAAALAGAPPGGAADAALPDAVLREQLFLAGAGTRRLDLPSVLTLVKSRLRATGPDEEYRSATRSLYARYLALVSSPPDIRTRWTRFGELCAEERAVLDRLDRGRAGGDRELLRRLATPSAFDFSTADDIRVELSRRKIACDPWDELALDTSLYYSQLLP
ncbi:nucleoside-diphosphate kinase [Streptomyces sp. NPDC046985]|uniref:nucleoside-diphosphate kinase n=1 Tax=Streptomyces sp. NPDC046985 TaxID=3155377 RepID=UPI0033DF3C85